MRNDTLLSVKDLSINFKTENGLFEAVKNLNYTLKQSKTLSIIGESGSGKSVSALSILKLLPDTAQYQCEEIIFDGQNITDPDKNVIEGIRGNDIGMIFQEPMTSLNPLHTIEKQIAETITLHQPIAKGEVRKKVCDLLDQVQLPKIKERLNAYPHELSGGQRQRIMIAMAIANNPKLLIADEPTTALDVTVQLEILKLLEQLQKDNKMAMLFISHDLNLVESISDDILVMEDGYTRDYNSTKNVFSKPTHDYTKMLLSAKPDKKPVKVNAQSSTAIETDNIEVSFSLKKNFFGKTIDEVKAVDKISIQLNKGKTLGIVGESGSGKTTFGLAILKLLSSKGKIIFDGKDISEIHNKQFLPYRNRIQIVFQDPFGALSPRMSVEEIITEGLTLHRKDLSKDEIQKRLVNIMDQVGLDPETKNRYPHEFSGGQRQRISIARAMILEPELVILDEPTSALDISVQISVLNLLKKLQKEKGLSYIFISHDLRVIQSISHDILVMKDGQAIEYGDATSVFKNPKDDYTKKLFKAAFLKSLASAA